MKKTTIKALVRASAAFSVHTEAIDEYEEAFKKELQKKKPQLN